VNAQELAELAARDLEPLLAASAIIGPSVSRRNKRGGRYAPGNSMWISVPGGLEVLLVRSLPLSQWEAGLLQPYGDSLADLEGVADAVARTAGDEVALRAIAAQLGGPFAVVVEKSIRFLFRCAATTYEGQPVHLNLLIDLGLVSNNPAIGDLDLLQSFDWHALLGSGLDTGFIVDQAGGVVKVEDIRLPPMAGSIGEDLQPDAFRHVAGWTEQESRISVSLSRSRELLIHQNGRLRYIYRSGQWRGLPLDVALNSAWSTGSIIGKPVKRAVIASVIDASLGHHGGSLAVIVKQQVDRFTKAAMIQLGDLWPTNVRSRLFSSQRFMDLTRRQRLELLSMDGATVIDHTGVILTAGAIVAVPAGSSGGGRLAATKALAQFGAAFKISQDGPISLFGRDATGAVDQKMVLA
jgi:hypothetical protein